MIKPMIVGMSQPSPILKNGKNFVPTNFAFSVNTCGIIIDGKATIKSIIAAKILNIVADIKTFLSKSKNLPNSERSIRLIVRGYKNMSTGTAYVMIAVKPKFDTTNEKTVKTIAQVFSLKKFGNILLNISEQLITSEMAVLIHASVTVARRK